MSIGSTNKKVDIGGTTTSVSISSAELERLTAITYELLRQTTKVAMLLSAMSGMIISDEEIRLDL